jgi:AcrR family transcriptional regulator
VSTPPASQPIWTRPEPGARRPRFSREQIAAAALAIADAEGFDAVSIRRIAAALDAGTMSLYRYISAKSDLVALMDDAIMGESLIDGELPSDWREALALIARKTREALLRHPWAVQALQGAGAASQDGAFGPNGIRHFEQSLAALATAPLDTTAKLDLITLVDDYVFGHVLRAGEQQARFGEDDPGHAAEIAGYIQRQIATGQFPHLEKLTHDPAAQTLADPGRVDVRFERGLRALLDGAAAGPAAAGPAAAGTAAAGTAAAGTAAPGTTAPGTTAPGAAPEREPPGTG